MCILVLAWQLIEDRPLVLLNNRDEFLQRPTQHLHWWPDLSILAGRDGVSGGSWFGMTAAGRWAVVTNFRQVPAPEGKHTRGALVTAFLESTLSPMDFARQIDGQAYSGFNLIVGDRQQAVACSNRGLAPTALPAGVYVLSNALLDTPWPKVERLRRRFSQEVLPLLMAPERQKTGQADAWQRVGLDLLQDERQAEAADLPDTGIGPVWEQVLSSIFIRAPGYGTRSSTLLTFGQHDFVMEERTYDDSGSGHFSRVRETGSFRRAQ